jgi:hypothetical protein
MSDLDSSAPLSWPQYKACCRELDRRVAAGELTSVEAVRLAYEVGLICNQAIPRLPREISDVMAFYPERIPDPAFEPWLLVAFTDDVFGGPRIYRPAQGASRRGLDGCP